MQYDLGNQVLSKTLTIRKWAKEAERLNLLTQSINTAYHLMKKSQFIKIVCKPIIILTFINIYHTVYNRT